MPLKYTKITEYWIPEVEWPRIGQAMNLPVLQTLMGQQCLVVSWGAYVLIRNFLSNQWGGCLLLGTLNSSHGAAESCRLLFVQLPADLFCCSCWFCLKDTTALKGLWKPRILMNRSVTDGIMPDLNEANWIIHIVSLLIISSHVHR